MFSKCLHLSRCGVRTSAAMLFFLFATSWAIAQQTVKFVGVALDKETQNADAELIRYLGKKTSLKFQTVKAVAYLDAIHRVAKWPRGSGEGPYLARMTPYAYVAAEMLGADFEILATYRSKAAKGTTYHSYFVVGQGNFQNSNPGVDDLLKYLRDHATQPAHFIYHDKFSTSSYFLPALFFRSEHIFATNEVHGNLTPILSTKLAPQSGRSVAKSGELVEAVAAGQADLAAVWDGTKNDVANQTATRVRFIRLPTAIPNDLLVCSAWLDQNSQEKIREAIRSTQSNNAGHIQAADFQPTGDFQWWEDIRDAPEAREALATLRRLAAEHPAPVTVNVQASDFGVAPTNKYLEAAKQAIRLSGTELVLFDSDFHKHPDVTWTLKPIHDGAVVLTSKIEDFDLEPQSFQISFTTVRVANGDTDYSDLTKRIGALIHSRMHRIRYIWPYEEGSPTVIRNVEFSIPKGVPCKSRKLPG